jgi:hypothetical protein
MLSGKKIQTNFINKILENKNYENNKTALAVVLVVAFAVTERNFDEGLAVRIGLGVMWLVIAGGFVLALRKSK